MQLLYTKRQHRANRHHSVLLTFRIILTFHNLVDSGSLADWGLGARLGVEPAVDLGVVGLAVGLGLVHARSVVFSPRGKELGWYCGGGPPPMCWPKPVGATCCTALRPTAWQLYLAFFSHMTHGATRSAVGVGDTVRSDAPSSRDCSAPPRAPSPAARWRRASATARPEEPLSAGESAAAASAARRA